MFCRSPSEYAEELIHLPAVIEFIDEEWIEYDWYGVNSQVLKYFETEVVTCPHCLSKNIDCGIEFIWYCEDCEKEFDNEVYVKLFRRWRYVRREEY